MGTKCHVLKMFPTGSCLMAADTGVLGQLEHLQQLPYLIPHPHRHVILREMWLFSCSNSSLLALFFVATKKTPLLPSNKERVGASPIEWTHLTITLPSAQQGQGGHVGKKVAVPGRLLSREGGGTAIVKEIVGRKWQEARGRRRSRQQRRVLGGKD